MESHSRPSVFEGVSIDAHHSSHYGGGGGGGGFSFGNPLGKPHCSAGAEEQEEEEQEAEEQEAEELVSSTEVSAAKSSETVTRLARAFKGMKAKAAEHATDAASLRAQVAKLERILDILHRVSL